MALTVRRRDPEQLLRQAQAEEQYERSGRLKIFLGYASGVGKSFRMLDEGRRRKERGQDVVVGAVQVVNPTDVGAVLAKLEVIPLKMTDGIPAMDLEAILRRRPSVCLVDGLAYDNPPGSLNPKRWQDVQQLVQTGITVITSVNIQYIEEVRSEVEAITGKHVTQTVPQSFLRSADEIAVVDAPPEMCMRLESTPEAQAAAEQKLSELRELALVMAADVVDAQLETYLERNGIKQSFGTQERILVCITPRANAGPMIQSGRRNADRFHGELHAIYIKQAQVSKEDEAALDRNLEIARAQHAEIHVGEDMDPIEAILDYARSEGVTQIFVGHSMREKWIYRLLGSPLDTLIRRADGIDVRVFPH